MEFSLNNKNTPLCQHSYFISNPSVFFYRHCDTGFKNKWSGLWNENLKLLDFFALSVNGEYLSEHNCHKTTYDYVKAQHFHKTKKGEIVQSLWVPEKNPLLILELQSQDDKNVEVLLETGINIRKREENLHFREYNTEQLGENTLLVSSPAGNLFIKSLNSLLKFEESPHYSEHFPSGEKQRYFVPGKIKIRENETIAFSAVKDFNLKESELGNKYSAYSEKTSIIKCNDPLIESIYKKAILNLELLKTDKSHYAGIPWFLQLWARDLFWSVPALLYAGFQESAKKTIELFSDNMEKGRVPNYIYGSEKTYNSIDSNLLFVIALHNYVSFTGDLEFLKKHLVNASKALTYARSRIGIGSMIKHDREYCETWMDTINRKDYAVEIQALFVDSLEKFSWLVFQIEKVESELVAAAFEAQGISKRLREQVKKLYFSEKRTVDRIEGSNKDFSKRPNFLFAALMEQENLSKIIEEYEKKDILGKAGLATLAANEQEFSPEKYHNGAAWSLCTGWLACAEFACGRAEKGREILQVLNNLMEKNAVGCIGECWNSKTAESIGCDLQLWGAAFIIRAIDEFMFGIKPNAITGTISIDPVLPKSVKYANRVLCIKGKPVTVSLIQTEKGVKSIIQR